MALAGIYIYVENCAGRSNEQEGEEEAEEL